MTWKHHSIHLVDTHLTVRSRDNRHTADSRRSMSAAPFDARRIVFSYKAYCDLFSATMQHYYDFSLKYSLYPVQYKSYFEIYN